MVLAKVPGEKSAKQKRTSAIANDQGKVEEVTFVVDHEDLNWQAFGRGILMEYVPTHTPITYYADLAAPDPFRKFKQMKLPDKTLASASGIAFRNPGIEFYQIPKQFYTTFFYSKKEMDQMKRTFKIVLYTHLKKPVIEPSNHLCLFGLYFEDPYLETTSFIG